MPDVSITTYGTVRRPPEGDIQLCDLGPGDLMVGAGGSELLLHVDPGTLPKR
jgi:hypothetical protein